MVILCKSQTFLLCYRQSVEYSSLPMAAHGMPDHKQTQTSFCVSVKGSIFPTPLNSEGQSL